MTKRNAEESDGVPGMGRTHFEVQVLHRPDRGAPLSDRTPARRAAQAGMPTPTPDHAEEIAKPQSNNIATIALPETPAEPVGPPQDALSYRAGLC